jgi:cell division septation protein DedD
VPATHRTLKVLSSFALAVSLHGAGHVLVLETNPGDWQFIPVSDVQVNDRSRVLLDPDESAPSRKPVHPAAYKRLKAIRLSEAPPIVAHPKGGALTPWGAADKLAVVTPEGHRLESPMTSDYLWSSTWISFAESGQRRKRQALSTVKVFAIVPAGADVANTLSEFVLKPEFFFDRGPQSDGFRKRMSLVAAVTAAYPTHVASRRLSEYIFQEMSLRFFRAEHDANAYGDLLDSLAFAAVSQRIQPEDERHKKMRNTVNAFKKWIDRDRARLKALAAVGAVLGGDGVPVGLEIRGGERLREAAALLVAENIEGAAKVLMDGVSASRAEAPAAWRVLRELEQVSPEVREYLARTAEPSAAPVMETVVAAAAVATAVPPVAVAELRIEEPAAEPVSEGVDRSVRAVAAVLVGPEITPPAVPQPAAPDADPTLVRATYQPPVAGKVLVIQVGAYRDGRGAEAMVRTLSAKGFPAQAKREGAVFRVNVGPFSSDRAAQEVRTQLAREGYNGFVRAYLQD